MRPLSLPFPVRQYVVKNDTYPSSAGPRGSLRGSQFSDDKAATSVKIPTYLEGIVSSQRL